MAVLLLSVDRGRKPGDEERLLKATHSLQEKLKLDWPNIFVPDSWSGVLRTFNIKGYGLILVDPKGIVRGAGFHAKDLESMMKAIYG